jgi:hypothetical protein
MQKEYNSWSVMLLKFYTCYDRENMSQISVVYIEESKIHEKFLSLYYWFIVPLSFMSSIVVVIFINNNIVEQNFGKYCWFIMPSSFTSLVTVVLFFSQQYNWIEAGYNYLIVMLLSFVLDVAIVFFTVSNIIEQKLIRIIYWLCYFLSC